MMTKAKDRDVDRDFWRRFGVEPSERIVEVSEPGTRIRVQETGRGEPVLFIHGTGGPGTYFAPLAPYLADRRCVFIDRPGWGGSTPIRYAGRRYADVTADILRGVLDGLGLERVDIVGASIGDLWALRFAQAAPDRIRRIALLGGAPLTAAIRVPPFIRLLRSPIGRIIAALPEKEKTLRAQMSKIGHAEGAIPQDFVDWHLEMSRTTEWPKHEREMVRAIVTRDGFAPGLVLTDEETAAIAAPLLMVFGSDDPNGSVATWRRFVGGFPNGRLEVVDGGGHLVWYDDEELVGTALHDFLTA